eukprot:2373681-Ditylum_brightwellii.AAC.1
MAKVEYKLHVANTLGIYDMILSRDILKSLGIILNHATEIFTWDDASIPMTAMPAQTADSFHIEDQEGINDMVGRIDGDKYKTILKATYEKANLKKEVEDK